MWWMGDRLGFFVVYKDRGFEILVRGGSGTHRGLVAVLHWFTNVNTPGVFAFCAKVQME